MGGFSGGANAGGGGSKSGGNPNYRNNNANTGIVGGGSVANNKTRGSAFGRAARDVGNFIARGGFTGAIIRGVTGANKKGKAKAKDKKINDSLLETSDYQGDVSKKPTQALTYEGGGRDQDNPQGIQLAKKVAEINETILSPAKIQAEAANNVKGPTTTEMSADQIALANKRKGRRSTNITAKKTLAKNYKLSEKTLLG